MNEHIDNSFDDFLKDENIKISEDEVRRRIEELSSVHCNFKYSIATRNKAFKEINILKQQLDESEVEE